MPDNDIELTPEEWTQLEAASRPPGLLSFMYWVKHDALLWDAFHESEGRALALFGIDTKSDIGKQILEIGEVNTDPALTRPRLAALFREHLVDEFMDEQPHHPW